MKLVTIYIEPYEDVLPYDVPQLTKQLGYSGLYLCQSNLLHIPDFGMGLRELHLDEVRFRQKLDLRNVKTLTHMYVNHSILGTIVCNNSVVAFKFSISIMKSLEAPGLRCLDIVENMYTEWVVSTSTITHLYTNHLQMKQQFPNLMYICCRKGFRDFDALDLIQKKTPYIRIKQL